MEATRNLALALTAAAAAAQSAQEVTAQQEAVVIQAAGVLLSVVSSLKLRRPRSSNRVRTQQMLAKVLSAREANPEWFRRTFRLTPSVFDALVRELAPVLTLHGRHAFPPEVAVLVTLLRLGCRTYFHVTADFLDLGDSTAFKLFWRTVDAINHFLLPRVVKWPADEEALQSVRSGFAAYAGIDNVVGAIDGTHVSVHPPLDEGGDYLDRAYARSVVSQFVVDHRGLVLDVCSALPGSAHDMKLFKHSSLYHNIEADRIVRGNDFLIADSGYFCRRYIIPPYDKRRNEPSEDEKAFNRAHAQTRGIVERTFGQIKARYRLIHDGVEGRAEDVKYLITACAALHNFALLHGEPEIDEDEDDDLGSRPPATRYCESRQSERAALAAGRARRDAVFKRWMDMRVARRRAAGKQLPANASGLSLPASARPSGAG